jgi:hypothetical protein
MLGVIWGARAVRVIFGDKLGLWGWVGIVKWKDYYLAKDYLIR